MIVIDGPAALDGELKVQGAKKQHVAPAGGHGAVQRADGAT